MKASSKASAGLERLLLPVVELRVPALGRFIEAHERTLGAVQLLPRRGLEPDDAHSIADREPTKFLRNAPEISMKLVMRNSSPKCFFRASEMRKTRSRGIPGRRRGSRDRFSRYREGEVKRH